MQGGDACVALWLNLIQGEKIAYVNNHETYGDGYRIPHDVRQ